MRLWVAKKSGTARRAGGKKMAQEIRYRPRPRALETFRKAVPTSWSLFSKCPRVGVSNKKCLDTVSRVVSMKSRYTFDTLRYTTIHFDTFMGKSHPDTWGKRHSPPSDQPARGGSDTGRCGSARGRNARSSVSRVPPS